MLRRAAYTLVTASWLIAATSATAWAAPAKAATASSEGAKAAPKSKPKPKSTAKPKSAAKPKPAAKSAPPMARKPGSKPGQADESARRTVAGDAGPAIAPADQHPESDELAAMRQIDAALFPVASSPASAPWLMGDVDIGAPATANRGTDGSSAPGLLASGMPPRTSLDDGDVAIAQPSGDLTWLKSLAMPDIPVRWDARVVRYLQYYRDDPRGRSMVATWIRKSGRYSESIRKVLREQGVPDDILWLALVESGFNPSIYSPVGAAGLWQFMPHGARIYGLTVDRWVDERLDPERSTIAAAKYLADLKQRFGAWELALAAYNMGYGGLLAAIRKYNTNDFWELSRFEAGVPYETALYVPKIVAMAIVARNCDVFHCADLTLDPPVPFDKVTVGAGVSLRAVADAAGSTESEIGKLNPQFLADRVPPALPDTARSAWTLRVPVGRGERAAKAIPATSASTPSLDRHRVRWGETLETIAGTYRVSVSAIQQANDLRRGEILRPGTVIYLPSGAKAGPSTAPPAELPVIVVPSVPSSIEGLRRVFYQPTTGDTLREVAAAFSVSQDSLCAWNMLDPRARLHSGMTLQVFVPPSRSLRDVRVVDEAHTSLLTVGSPEFFAHFEALKGRQRLEVGAEQGDTFAGVAKKYGLTMGMLERINQRSRYVALEPGEKLVVYATAERMPAPLPAPAPTPEPEPEPANVAVAAAAEKEDDEDPSAKPASEGDDSVQPAVLRQAVPPKP